MCNENRRQRGSDKNLRRWKIENTKKVTKIRQRNFSSADGCTNQSSALFLLWCKLKSDKIDSSRVPFSRDSFDDMLTLRRSLLVEIPRPRLTLRHPVP